MTSVLSIDDFVDDAARQFDQLTDGEDFDINEESESEEKRRWVKISFKHFLHCNISEQCTALSRTGVVPPILSTP